MALAPVAGLFAAPSGNGYHVYKREPAPWQEPARGVLLVTRMQGAKITVLHRLETVGGSFTLTPPVSGKKSWLMQYREYSPGLKGPEKTLALK